MREIKFRGWDEETKTMLEPQDLSQSGKYWTWLGKKDVEIMQFIGLKDKNGKEIYEGDIVKGYFDTDKVDDFIYLFVLNEEERNLGCKIFEVEDMNFGYRSPVPHDLEVIGNIYENPELLTKNNLNK